MNVADRAAIRVGPAGWSYKDWKGIVYPDPPPKGFDPLAYLAQYFDTIEINSSFYRPPTRNTALRWVDRVKDRARFKFTAKLWCRFTHSRNEAFTEGEVAGAHEALVTLHDAGKLGAVLVQFPWSFKRTDENREWLDDVVRAFHGLPLVVEVRHESWNVSHFYEELTERDIGFVNIDQPLYKKSIKPSAKATAAVGYIRVHGRNYQDWFRKNAGPAARYDYLYTPSELIPWVDRAREVAEQTIELYVITNNHFQGKEVVNALQLDAMMKSETVPAPPDLVSAYPEALGPYVN